MHRTCSYLMDSIAITIITIIIIRVNTLLLRCNLLGCLCCRLVVKRTSLRTVLCVVISFIFVFVSVFFKFFSLWLHYQICFIVYTLLHFVSLPHLNLLIFSNFVFFFFKCEAGKIGFIELSVVSVGLFIYFFFDFVSLFDCKSNWFFVVDLCLHFIRLKKKCLIVYVIVCCYYVFLWLWLVFGWKTKEISHQNKSIFPLNYVQWK